MNMNPLTMLAAAATLASCASSYNVQGVSSVSALDGSKLYLKAVKDNEWKNIDSCDVVHGEFHFNGTLDTVRMANMFMDDNMMMPMVLETGIINIRIDNASQTVGGTPLNDQLYEFIDKHRQLENQLEELGHKQSQMMLDGISEDVIARRLNQEAQKIDVEMDRLVTTFITDNFDNVLGPGVFMMMTSGFPYPVLTPQIEDIMSKATDKFKNDPYVHDYYQAATENEARMRGVSDAPTQQPSVQPTPADTSMASAAIPAPGIPAVSNPEK